MMLNPISTIALIAAAYAKIVAADPWGTWVCHADGNISGELQTIYNTFNDLFGTAALTAAAGQSYIGVCNGYYFGLDNAASYKWTEKVSERSTAAGDTPGGGDCVWYTDDGKWQYYLFGKEDQIDLSSDGVTARYC